VVALGQIKNVFGRAPMLPRATRNRYIRIPRQAIFFSFLQINYGNVGENLSASITTDVVLCRSAHVAELSR